MRTGLLVLLTIIIFLASCAGGPGVLDKPPEWAESEPQDSADVLYFRGSGTSETLASAKLDAISDLNDAILAAMDLGDPEKWAAAGTEAVNEFLALVEQAVRTPEYAQVEGLSLVNKDGWFDEDRNIVYTIDISWDREAFDRQIAELAELTGVTSLEFRELEERANRAEDDGNAYEAALIWSTAAGIAEANANQPGYRQALGQVERLLNSLTFSVVSFPTESYVDQRPADPVVFSVASRDKPVGSAEFLITYIRSARDGSPTVGEARVFSDNSGVVRFRPPAAAFPGVQRVTIAPSIEPFLEFLVEPENSYVDGLIASVESPSAEAAYEVLSRIREIPMGVLILETDLAGNALSSTAAAIGLLDDLSAEGFNVDIMTLNPQEMLTRTERELLRDLKADERFSERYERVIHGTVSLESFEQNGGNFSVRVTGTLAMSDIQRQVTLYRSEITKTSRASDSQQAISSAFRQLGRSFAEELIQQAP
jgi:hypothetical protein